MMRNYMFILALLLVVPLIGCKDSGSILFDNTGVQGQVYLISKPGPIPIGWIAPPLEQVTTVQVLDAQRNIVQEERTSDKGRFMIWLQPAAYYLRVKESPIRAETGPYEVAAGEVLTVEAHFDNGMR